MPAHTEEIWADVLAGTEPSFDFKGNESNNTIYGWSKDDTLSGLKGDDYLLSDDGDDSLTGGKGKDTLAGGLGNDTYYIDSLDQILESEDGGIDTVNAINQSITLAENLENANVVQDKVRLLEVNGNSSSNHITGVSSRLPRAQGLYLNGLGGNDTLEGSLLNDTLDGSTGVDSLIGGSGNDVYYLDSRHDKVIELSDNGRDKIYTRSLYSLLVTPHVEDIELQGTLNIGLIGNDLDNEITGNLGHNALLGGIGNDSLIGGFGNDSLDGGTGADTLFGGSGRDEYTIRGINDIIQESEMNTDIDHVKSYISFSLVANRYGQVRDIENLSLVGNQATYAYGNPLDNRITGNDLDNTLIGFGGMDIIKGGLGADRIAGGDDFDTFLYTSISESPFGENDVITDFDQSQFDVIDLTDIDANVNIAGDQAFELSFSSDFIPEAGTAVFNSSTKMLNLYVDSTVLPSMSIEIPSVDILRSSDLYL
ncbi:hypothetical protein KR100_01985 [Synechococcus sp. KORDI-100]|nr:hypothetical protein KR100_01985 [Synechococcus sp. KORDI-100]